jgi:feruloyl-CoA synthase
MAARLTPLVDADLEVCVYNGVDGSLGRGHRSAAFESTAATEPTPAVDAAMQATGPDTIVKFLFTSGSTKLPKAVINTQRMWCANQQQMRQSMPVLAEEGQHPVLVDWLPWNHTFGGNHNFGMVMYNGGTLYIDDGKPVAGPDRRDAAQPARDRPHLYFNVPTGFEAIANAMQTDDGAAAQLAVPASRCSSMPAPRWPSRSGTACTPRRRRRSASAS